MRRIGRRAWQAAALAAVALALLALLAVPASAEARVCRELEAELASTGGDGGSSQFTKYDRAAAAQREQLSMARSRARRVGCGLAFLETGRAICALLDARIERMERNLGALERERAALAGAGSSTRDRARILALLDANDCRDVAAAERQPAPGNGSSLFDRLFGGGVREGLPSEEPERPPFEEREPFDGRQPLEEHQGPASVTRILNPNGEISILGPVGEFSTMCVRTCDGYYFPMSPHSSSADFDRDLKNCESTCPGTEMQLYYQDAVGEESETMVSAGTGEPYSSLPTAYLYRDAAMSRPPGCGCNPAKNFSIIGETAQPSVPVGRPNPADDPQTLADRQGGPDVETTGPAGGRKVRVVGPVFLPDPAESIFAR